MWPDRERPVYASGMLVERLINVRELLTTHNFANLMELYERNFRHLQALAPGLHRMPDRFVSHGPGGLSLHLEVQERHKYTTVLNLTHYFERDERSHAVPDVQIRVYHDARQAEVTRCCGREGFLSELGGLPDGVSVLQRKWTLNVFLDRWLEYCVEQGYEFLPVASD
jgi:uncharacterized protein YqiB (DUF1249 family)